MKEREIIIHNQEGSKLHYNPQVHQKKTQLFAMPSFDSIIIPLCIYQLLSTLLFIIFVEVFTI